MSDDTIFHKIINREIPADIVYESDSVIAFKDIAPMAPVHVLFVPKKSIATLNDAKAEDAALLGELMLAAVEYARREGMADNGYRVVMNCNDDGGQTVYQLHLHLLGGTRLAGFGAAGSHH